MENDLINVSLNRVKFLIENQAPGLFKNEKGTFSSTRSRAIYMNKAQYNVNYTHVTISGLP